MICFCCSNAWYMCGLVKHVHSSIMYCKNTEIFYVLLFLILFVLSHFLLVQYRINHMSAGQKLRFNKGKPTDSYGFEEVLNKKDIHPFHSGFWSPNRFSLQGKSIPRNIIEPPLPKEKEAEYALNMRYFQRLHNCTIFR